MNVPVFGIGESSMLAVMSLGKNIGISSGVEAAIPRHYRYWEGLGITNRIIGDVATDRGVLGLESEGAYRGILTTGGKLTKIGANVFVLSCTGMTHGRPDYKMNWVYRSSSHSELRGVLKFPDLELLPGGFPTLGFKSMTVAPAGQVSLKRGSD